MGFGILVVLNASTVAQKPVALDAASVAKIELPATLSKQELEMQVALRQAFGLESGGAFVLSVAGDPERELELGIMVTAEEAADLRARGAAQTAISEFKQEVAAKLPGYAGFYVDQANGGTIVVMSTIAGAQDANAVLVSAPSGVNARTVVVNTPMDQLEVLRAQVDESREALAAEGIVLNGVGIDIPQNRVVAGVHPLTDAIKERLHDIYPDLAVVDEPAAEVAACQNRSDCMGPLRAGIAVNFPGYMSCTSNYVASTGGSGSNVFLITAGHCAPAQASAYHNGNYIGKATKWHWFQGGNSDALAIDIAESQKSNLLYITNDSMISITARQSPTADYPGQIICHSGTASGVRCGTLWGSETQNFSNVVLYDVRRVTNLIVAHGDSGGPASVYQTGTASGIIMGSNYTPAPNARGWFTNIYYAERDLGLYVCRSMACTNF